MNILYTAPTRAHHYRYATALHEAGVLHRFVSGFSRFSPRAALPGLGSRLLRADWLQTVYLASLKAKAPNALSNHLAYLAKIEQDYACARHLAGADLFMFYNGSGLHTCAQARKRGITTVVEVVNAHVAYQEQILADEHRRLGLPWTPFHHQEKARRIAEYEAADYILTPSDFVKRSFIDYGFPEQKLLKVPYGFEAPPVEAARPTSGTFTVLYVGSISVRKGVRYLIEAFSRLNHPHKKLVLVGPRTQPDGLHNLDMPQNVSFTGSLKGDALAAAYQSADVFCLPSLEDGFGLVLGEALSYGLPVVTTTNTGGYDLFTDKQEGFVVPIRDPDALHQKLQLLADDDALRDAMRHAARTKAQGIQGWPATGDRLVGTLQRLLSPIKRPVSV